MAVTAVLLGAAAVGGCGVVKAPSLPAPIQTPAVRVEAVRRVEVSERAARYEVLLAFRNENDVALPMVGSLYELSVGGASYESDTPPNAVIPANGSIRLVLPAVLRGERGGGWRSGGTYAVRGSVELRPPGQIRRTFYEFGLPRPRVSFRDRGRVVGAVPGGAGMDEPPSREGREEETGAEGDRE